MMTTWSQCVLLVVEGLSGRPTLNSVESTCSQEELSSSLLRQLMVLLRLLWMIHLSFSWLRSVALLFCCHNSACSSSRWKRSTTIEGIRTHRCQRNDDNGITNQESNQPNQCPHTHTQPTRQSKDSIIIPNNRPSP